MDRLRARFSNKKALYRTLGISMMFLGVAGMILSAWVFLADSNDLPDQSAGLPVAEARDSAPEKSEDTVDENTIPRLEIPSIGVVAGFEHVGVDEYGNMQEPSTSDVVAWFEEGSYPGEGGNTVLAGHVDTADSINGGIFGSIFQLNQGEEIKFFNDDQVFVYEVTATNIYPYDTAPTEQIFGETDHEQVTLITCSGAWDAEQSTYDNRLVVVARRVI